MTKADLLSYGAAILTRDEDPGGGAIDSAKLYRDLELDLRAIDEEARTVPASLSSEIEIKRFFGTEVLEHSARAVNFERAKQGLPLLFGHDQRAPIGLVEDVRLDGDKLRGVLRFSKNARAEEIWNDVREGFLKNISIGYRIDKWEESTDDDVVRAIRWTPFEASIVSVPADHTVGVNRDDPALAAAALAPQAGAPAVATRDDDGGTDVVKFQDATAAARREGRAEAERSLLDRQNQIRTLFAPFLQRGPDYIALRDQFIGDGATYDVARKGLLDILAGETPAQPAASDLHQAPGSANGVREQPVVVFDPEGRRTETIKVGKEGIEKFRDGVTEALTIRAELSIPGRKVERERMAEARKDNEFVSMSPVELAREYLRHVNTPFGGMSRDAVVGLALNTRGLISHSTSDFANILEDVANKSLQIGYNEAPETWTMWCRTGSLPDFRQGNRPNLSAFGDLQIVYEDGEYTYGSFSDLKEVLTLATYGKLFSISRQALVNDDLDALGRIPAAMGRAASRTVGDLAYNVLINNPTMNQDATALFDATHGNFVAGGSGAAPSVATINAARVAMGTQTDPSGAAILNIVPKFLICPRALEGTALQIQMAEKDPAIASGEAPNFVRGTFETVAEGRLDANDPAAWFMAADAGAVETIEVAFLEGQSSPYMETQNGWSTDGAAYKVRIDAVAAPLDFRGLYMNDGN